MSSVFTWRMRPLFVRLCFLFYAGTVQTGYAQPETVVPQYSDGIATTTLASAPGKLGPNTSLIFKLDNGLVTDPHNYHVAVDGIEMALKGPPTWCAQDKQLTLTLAADTPDKPQWRSAYRHLFAGQHAVTVDLEAKSGNTVLQHLQVSDVPLGFQSWRIALGAALGTIMLLGALAVAKYSAILRDPMLPQLQQQDQPYSLARCQMLFWTVLIMTGYVLLYALTGNYETITPQMLILMGISGTTGLAAYGVDVIKDTPIDRANRYLRSIGINSYDDVEAAQDEIKILAHQSDPVSVQRRHDLELLLRSYAKHTARFKSDHFWRDIVTDINGSALHRLQLVCWTLILGFVFVHEVLMTLAMPVFDTTLLVLLGISGGGYVLMKYPEVQH